MKVFHSLLLGAALVTSTAHAGLPLITEDASVLAPRDCELEAGALSQRDAGATSLEQVLNLACGIGFGTQVGLTAGRLKEGDARIQQGALGGKVSLWQGEEGAGATLVAAAVWARNGSDNDSGWQQTAFELGAVFTQPVSGDLLAHFNLGHRRDRLDGQQSTLWRAALEHEGFALGGPTLAPMAEVFGTDREAPWWNVGLRLTLIPEQLSVGLSYGQQINPERVRLAIASLKLAF